MQRATVPLLRETIDYAGTIFPATGEEMHKYSLNVLLVFCIMNIFGIINGYAWINDTSRAQDAQNDQQEKCRSTDTAKEDNLPNLDALIAKAEQGDAQAQFSLGMMYRKGVGVSKNCANAFKWLKKAAEQGHSNAQILLGTMYDSGEGVEQNEQEALKWYKKTCRTGTCHFADILRPPPVMEKFGSPGSGQICIDNEDIVF
jgi:hypothetical protein